MLQWAGTKSCQSWFPVSPENFVIVSAYLNDYLDVFWYHLRRQGLELRFRPVNPRCVALRAVAKPSCSERVLRAVKAAPCVTKTIS